MSLKDKRQKDVQPHSQKETNLHQDSTSCWALMAHTCNPSYSGGRNQGDRSSSQSREVVPGKQFTRPYLENTLHKKGLVEWLDVGPEFKPQYHKKKKKKMKNLIYLAWVRGGLTSVILASWEAEIRRIKVQGQPRQIVHETYLQNSLSKMNERCGSSHRKPAL
jgi:hypothetical protein